ncbi:dTDP-4-dehydrorhamnose reductase [Patescibacteria group bacterium]|nr:dTDP-4-dehydrorhamnose reductase [Patescibacteria group bacterium]
MPKIILTGSDGMLGKALKKELSGSSELQSFSKNELDITDFVAVAEILEAAQPDFVVNAAAFTKVDAAETDQILAEKVNSTAVGNLARICKKIGAKLIHFSTDYVFDGENENGFPEKDEPNPINFYGKTKLEGEEAIRESGCEFAIIRTSWLFGEGENFVEKMLALGKRNCEIKVVADQIGCPTFSEDLAEAVKKILIENRSGIFHLTNLGKTSWADFARKIFGLAGMDVKVIPVASEEFPTPAKRPRNSVLQNTKLPKMRSWEEALAEFLH